jgi:hypothetical protein
VFLVSWDLALITFGGVLINFGPQIPQFCYQLLLAGLFNCYRLNQLPPEIGKYLFAASEQIPQL